jgi:AraC-like DNA-binding protein
MVPQDLNRINPYIISCTHVNRENSPPKGTVYKKRCVKWYELELILWGEGFIVTEGENLPALAGTLFFRRPGITVQGYPPYHCYMVVFDMIYDEKKSPQYSEPDFTKTDFSKNGNGGTYQPEALGFNVPDSIRPQAFTRVTELFLQLFNCYVENGVKNQFYLKTYLMQLLLQVYTDWQNSCILDDATRSVRMNYPKIMKIKEYIETNIRKRLKINELAQIANVSPNFLCSIFKKITGETIIDTINNEKIILAKMDLVNTDKRMKEISYDLGFENDTYFYTLFRKKSGISPSAYRYLHRLR